MDSFSLSPGIVHVFRVRHSAPVTPIPSVSGSILILKGIFLKIWDSIFGKKTLYTNHWNSVSDSTVSGTAARRTIERTPHRVSRVRKPALSASMVGPVPFKGMHLVCVILLASSFLSILASASLGIKQDQTAKNKRLYVWSSVATFDKDNTEIFNTAEFYGIAKQAYEEMASDWSVQNTPERQQPNVMAALGIGNEIYFSSSVKGGSFVYDDNSRDLAVAIALRNCQIGLQDFSPDITISEKHRTKASCAEVLAVHQYYQDPQHPPLGPSRMVAFGKQGNQLTAMKPCGGINVNDPDYTTWGCKQFMEHELIEIFGKIDPVAIDPPVTPISTRQVVIC